LEHFYGFMVLLGLAAGDQNEPIKKKTSKRHLARKFCWRRRCAESNKLKLSRPPVPKASIDRAQGKLLPCLHAAGQAGRPTDWPLARSPSDDRTEPTHHPTTQRCIHLLMPGYLISTALNRAIF
jgi:hypothetical protein